MAARPLLDESLALHREQGGQIGLAYALCNLGSVALAQGDYDAARSTLQEGLRLSDAMGAKMLMMYLLNALAGVAISQPGGVSKAVWLASAAEGLRTRM